MGTWTYLIDDKEKLLIPIGSNITYETFHSDYEEYCKVKEIIWSFDFDTVEGIFEKSCKFLSLRDVTKLGFHTEIISSLASIVSSFLSLEYASYVLQLEPKNLSIDKITNEVLLEADKRRKKYRRIEA